MKYDYFLINFADFIADCPTETLEPGTRYVFMSDLHMGNGSSRDDLVRNRQLIEGLLDKWYLHKDYTLVLNGDIEDLSKFELPDIMKAWPRVYETLAAFDNKNRLRKIAGNHDLTLFVEDEYPFKVLEGLVLMRGNEKACVFHGHQSSNLYMKYNRTSEFLIRYFVKPLHIRNTGVSRDSRRRWAKERRIYRAAREFSILAITGHTHRPLFESLSKYDNIRFSVEKLMGEYVNTDGSRKKEIETEIRMLRREMEALSSIRKRERKTQSLYSDSPFLVPCLFNSGCATGKHGITALEISDGEISLVYWTLNPDKRPYIQTEAQSIESAGGKLYRYTIQKDSLDSVFSRIRLLGGSLPRA